MEEMSAQEIMEFDGLKWECHELRMAIDEHNKQRAELMKWRRELFKKIRECEKRYEQD